MRVTAYVLAADPWFLAASLSSYYDRVDRIVVSYDRSGTSWTGTPLPIDECLSVIKAVDVDGKCVDAPGDYWRPGNDPMDNETHQRRQALALASRDADWIVQLDTDEVLASPDAFFASLARAEQAQAQALHFPSRWLYSRVADAGAGSGRYLERCSRLWRPAASFPGPLAVRAGTELTYARQADGARHYRVDLRPRTADPDASPATTVHEVVRPDQAVLHFSWVRPADIMRRKFAWSGHAADLTRPVVYERWAARSRHPWRTVATTPLRRGPWLRLVTLDDADPGGPLD